jgi:hypothetical protein
MTDEEQFAAINQPEYFNKLKARINGIKNAMASNEASADAVKTRVDGVPIVVEFVSENEGRLRVGLTNGGREPLYDWTFPIRWLEETPPPAEAKRSKRS